MEPPVTPLAVFVPGQRRSDDHLERARRLLERAIRQRWADGMLNRESVAGAEGTVSATLGPAEIERLMRPPAQPTELVTDHRYDPATAIGEMVDKLGLQATEADLLAVLLACETDPASARLAAYLAGTPHAFAMTVDTLFEIAYRPRSLAIGEAAALLHSDLAADGLARRLRFLIVDGVDSRPFLAQGVRLHPRMTGWLLGRRSLDSELTANAQLVSPDEPPGECDERQLALVVRAFQSPRRLIRVQGAPGSGREILLRFAAHRLGKPLLMVSGRGLDADRLVAAFREATLHGALLVVRDAEEALTPEGRARFRECLDVYPDTVALVGLGESAQAIVALRSTTEVAIPVPSHSEREKLWRTYLTGPVELTDVHWREIAGLYNLGIGGIVGACDGARELANLDGEPIDRMHVARAIRQLFDSDLKTVATRVEVTQTWDDVVLPEEIVDSLIGIVDRVAFRNEVLGDWGFGRKVGKGHGLTILFSGQPGTGKSMVAGLIARELGLDMYVIDLSRIMSKWIGETEKNLARAFDAAEAGHVLLLFDEADTLLGKRTSEVRSSNDRHANLETNFILARLEQFGGIAVFTTNILSAIDPAVMRRMSANIQFPFPDIESRAELWRRMIPAEAPVSGRIDFDKLARHYELSGGFIKNVVLRAAFSAAREGQPISMSHLERAVRGEYGDRGALTVGGRMA
ncbi:MAG: ATP-binding protein [Deltaproteobacteria bacterium]|nr:ATP-binding protein [Deltaproteobacteria bacterium]MDQ3301647.1 ATP-binding protein [Myxococcota bacterium]